MIEYIKKIVEYLSNWVVDVPVKATPEALWAPERYDLLEQSGVVLVWLDMIPFYVDKTLRAEDYSHVGGILYRNQRIVISVGLRSLADSSELDNLVQKLEDALIFLQIDDYSPLKPISMSRIKIDNNMVYWRQMFFDTMIRVNAQVKKI